MHPRAYTKSFISLFASCLAACSLLLGATPFLHAEDALTLPGADGKDYTPLAAGDKKAVVLFFVSAYCPTSNTFVPEINKIVADYSGKFAFYFVHADSDLKLTDVLQHTEMMGIKATVLMDKEQRLAKLAQAKITPEVVVLGADGHTLYQGRINDLYLGPTKKQRQATTKDLRDALDAIQAGTPVTNARTEAMGCKISGLK
jgi:thiol-disulfide isomerase/thioredoxin